MRQQTDDPVFQQGDRVRVIAGRRMLPGALVGGEIGIVHGLSATPTGHPLVDVPGMGRYLVPARCLERWEGPMPTAAARPVVDVPLRAEPRPCEDAPMPEPPAVDWCEPAEAWVRPAPMVASGSPIPRSDQIPGAPANGTPKKAPNPITASRDDRRARMSRAMRESHARRRAEREAAELAVASFTQPTGEDPPTLHDLAALLGQAAEMATMLARMERESA